MTTPNNWNFQNPHFVKTTIDGKTHNVYTFPINVVSQYPEEICAKESNCNQHAFTPAKLNTYLLDMYSGLLRVHSSKFVKPYTPAHLVRATTHTFTYDYSHIGFEADKNDEFTWDISPTKICLIGNNFNINWLATAQPARIQIVEEDIQEVDVDNAVAVAENDDFLRLNSPDKQRAIQLLQRAKLREKVARYRAERALTKYIAKYGDIDPAVLGISDEESSGSEDDE